MSGRAIYRLPPFKVGAQIYLYSQAKDRKPWSLVTHKVPNHWAETKGAGVTVAILDTGLWDHGDLPDPIFTGNFSASDTDYDRQGHGTHVAGTVGARLDGAGVVGWAPECNLAAVKVLGDDGAGRSDKIAEGIRYAANQGAHIINMSLGGPHDVEIEEACIDVIQQGVFVICAAGNEGLFGDNTVGYPAKLPQTLAVASYRKDGQISDFSSQGREVDIAFPGEDILSTWPENRFRSISGTSMATPACAGLTALMLACHWKAEKAGNLKTPIRNNRQLREHLKRHAQDVGEAGKDNAFGWGVPDVNGLMGDETRVAAVEPFAGMNGAMIIVEPITHKGTRGLFITTD